MAATREEVARAAVQLERDGRMFYLDLASAAASASARRMFEALADDELNHIEWIREMTPGIDAAATANRDLYERLRHIFADVPRALIGDLARTADDNRAIHLAIDMENKSVAAYQAWAAEAEDKDVRALCALLVGIEQFHRQVLENTLEYFNRTADWFMREEHWNFEGG